jgi:hypothetical protein
MEGTGLGQQAKWVSSKTAPDRKVRSQVLCYDNQLQSEEVGAQPSFIFGHLAALQVSLLGRIRAGAQVVR